MSYPGYNFYDHPIPTFVSELRFNSFLCVYGLLTLKRAVGRSRCPSLPCSRCPCRDLGCLGCVSSWRIKRACRIASVLMWRLHWSCSEACIPFTKTAGASGSCTAASPNRRMKYARLGPRPVNNQITKKIRCQVIQFVTDLDFLFGGHQQPFKRCAWTHHPKKVTFSRRIARCVFSFRHSKAWKKETPGDSKWPFCDG